MIQLNSNSRILVALKPVDFRRGIDGLCALCRNELDLNPSTGTIYVFTNRSRTQARMLVYDGTGYWLMTKRLSKGRFPSWPKSTDTIEACQAKELILFLWGENPAQKRQTQEWRKIG